MRSGNTFYAENTFYEEGTVASVELVRPKELGSLLRYDVRGDPGSGAGLFAAGVEGPPLVQGVDGRISRGRVILVLDEGILHPVQRI
jgi:hypothetical protein